MRKGTEKKTASVLCAAAVILVAALLLASILILAFREGESEIAEKISVALFVFVILAVIAGVAVSLAERLSEIKKGEEEEARKY